MSVFLVLIVGVQSAARRLIPRRTPRRIPRRLLARPQWASDSGQATTEYALVLLAAALVGVLVIGWATSGGGAAAVGRLFDTVIESAIEQL